MCLNIRSKNRHMSSPQAVIQNVHIKLKSNSQTQRSACIQYREHLHCMLPGHAEISSSQGIVTDRVSSSWLHLSKNRCHFFYSMKYKFLFIYIYKHMCISVYTKNHIDRLTYVYIPKTNNKNMLSNIQHRLSTFTHIGVKRFR